MEGGEIYERNPYTDVDKLVARMLGLDEIYEWKQQNVAFQCAGTTLVVSVTNERLAILNNGERSFVISKNIFFCNGNGEIMSTITERNFIVKVCDSYNAEILAGAEILLVKEGNRHLFIEL